MVPSGPGRWLVTALCVMGGAALAEPPRRCVPGPEVELPPPLRPGRVAAPRACPDGQVPAPVDRAGPKGRPGAQAPAGPRAPAPPAPFTYFYADTYQAAPVAGAVASMTQHRPRLGDLDYHSLAELAVTSLDGQQVVEVGWTVDRGVNGGDEGPHLFVFHWVNGNPRCYNGCGWVQVSGSRAPGMPLDETAEPQAYGLVSFQGAWWVWYQSEWLGYFPQTLWSAPTFTAGGQVQWFGEVATLATPHTEMGNGLFPGDPGAAAMTGLGLIPVGGAPEDGGAPDDAGPAAPRLFATNAAYYDVKFTGEATFRYGGPGWTRPDAGPAVPPDAGPADAGPGDAGPAGGGPAGCGCGAPGSMPPALVAGLAALAAGLLRRRAWRSS